jgi:hypothetical protein
MKPLFESEAGLDGLFHRQTGWHDTKWQTSGLDPCSSPAHMLVLFDSFAAFRGRGPLTVLLLSVFAHRCHKQEKQIDSRIPIPLSIAAAISVNEKQPSGDIFPKKFLCVAFRRRPKNKTAATSLPRRLLRGRKPYYPR